MSAYMVANFTVTNPDAYAPYPEAARETFAAHGVELVAADTATEMLEGEAEMVTVILRFASKEIARQWYDSAEYQAVLGLRTDNSRGRLLLLDGPD